MQIAHLTSNSFLRLYYIGLGQTCKSFLHGLSNDLLLPETFPYFWTFLRPCNFLFSFVHVKPKQEVGVTQLLLLGLLGPYPNFFKLCHLSSCACYNTFLQCNNWCKAILDQLQARVTENLLVKYIVEAKLFRRYRYFTYIF